jgi:hypothetical protein
MVEEALAVAEVGEGVLGGKLIIETPFESEI